jgi:hypothetical protein
VDAGIEKVVDVRLEASLIDLATIIRQRSDQCSEDTLELGRHGYSRSGIMIL